MKLFHASLPLGLLQHDYALFRRPQNILISFAYVNPSTPVMLTKYRYMIDEVILDSGAWSDYNGVLYVSDRQLKEYLHSYGHLYNRYFNLDRDFDDDGFDINIAYQMQMENEGLNPIPVVHNIFNDEIEYYIGTGKYRWIALGSKQSSNFKNLNYAVEKIKSLDEKMKIHWFGGGNYKWLTKLPIASCDISSWSKTGEHGFIKYWNHQVNRAHTVYVGGYIRKIRKSGFEFMTYPWRADLEEYLFTVFNLSFKDLCSFKGPSHRQLINTRYYTEMADRINTERIKNNVPLE